MTLLNTFELSTWFIEINNTILIALDVSAGPVSRQNKTDLEGSVLLPLDSHCARGSKA